MRGVLVLLVLSLSLGSLAGCVSDPLDPGAIAPDPRVETLSDGRTYVPNLFLLGEAAAVQNTRVSTGSEPAILVDKDGQYIWVGDTTGVYRSSNGGVSWQLRNPLLGGGFVISDGWHMAQDDVGTLYVVGLAEARLSVFRSFDKGTSWDLTTTIGDTFGAVPDRPWIAARGDGIVALIYNDSGLRTRCMISTDGGLTWPDQNPSSGIPISGAIDFDEDGNLYHTNKDGTVYKVGIGDATTQAGLPTQCARGNQNFDVTPGVTNHINHQLQTVASQGKAYVAVSNAQRRMSIAATDFTGFHPTTLVVSPPELKTNTFGTIAMQGDRLAVAWYGTETEGDPRLASFNGAWNVYVAVVDDFWTDPQVQVFRVTDAPNHVGDICMNGIGCTGAQNRELLDYFMVDIGPNGDIHVAYADDVRTARANSYYARIASP